MPYLTSLRYHIYLVLSNESICLAGMAELVDALDSKSSKGNFVWVRFPLSAFIPKKMKYLTIILILSFAACSYLSSNENSNTKSLENKNQITAINIFLAKGNLEHAEFEQFKISGSDFYYECGRHHSKKYKATQNKLIALNSQDSEKIQLAAQEIATTITQNKISWKEPGDGESFFDNGKVEVALTIDQKIEKIETSVSSLAQPVNSSERQLIKLIETIRGVSGTICNNASFYGIGKK